MNHYYIYYRVSERNADEAEMLARSMQARLACRSGVAGKLLKKRDEPGLWMAVYENVAVPERFERLLEQAVEEFDLALPSSRTGATSNVSPATTPQPQPAGRIPLEADKMDKFRIAPRGELRRASWLIALNSKATT